MLETENLEGGHLQLNLIKFNLEGLKKINLYTPDSECLLQVSLYKSVYISNIGNIVDVFIGLLLCNVLVHIYCCEALLLITIYNTD